MPTPQELEKQRKAIESQLLGGLAPGGMFTDEYGIPKVYSPKYYRDFTIPGGGNLGMKGITDKPTLAAELANVRLQQEKQAAMLAGTPMNTQQIQQRKAEIKNEIDVDYFGKPITQVTDFKDTYAERTPSTSLLGVSVDPATPYNRPPEASQPSFTQDPFGYLAAEAELIGEALRPQSVASEPTMERQRQDARRRGSDIDWDTINRLDAEALGLTERQQKSTTEAVKELYVTLLNKEENKDLSQEEVLKKTYDTISDMSNAGFITEQDPRYRSYGPSDPYVQAFNRQVFGENTEGVPDFTEEQMIFHKKRLNYLHDQFVGEQLDTIKEEQVPYLNVTIGGAGETLAIPTEIVRHIQSVNPKTTKPVFSSSLDEKIRQSANNIVGTMEIDDDLVPEDGYLPYNLGYVSMRSALAKIRNIKTFGDPDAWFLQPTLKEDILNNPEIYRYEGFFTDVSYSGAVAETDKMWWMRSALTGLNFVAGAAQNYVFEPIADVVVDGTDGKSLTEAKRDVIAQETPKYADHPILANIALGKGFAGEMDDTADAMGITGWGKTAMVGTGFAMDILDPTIGVAAAIGKGASVGKSLNKANAALLNAKSAKEISQIRNAAMVDEFLNDWNVVSLGNKAYRKVTGKGPRPNLYNGDIRLHFADDLAKEMEINAAIRRKTIENKPVAQIKSELIGEGYDINKGVAKAWSDEATRVLPESQDPVTAGKVAHRNMTQGTAKAGFVENQNFGVFQREFNEIDDLFRQIEKRAATNPEFIGLESTPGFAKLSSETKQLLTDVMVSKTGKRSLVGDELMRLTDDLEATAKSVLTRRFMFAETPTLPVGEIVAVTRNTWASPNKVDNIIAASNNTKLGQQVADIVKQGQANGTVIRAQTNLPASGLQVQTGWRTRLRDGTEVKPFFRFDKSSAEELITEMEKYNVPSNLYNRITTSINRGIEEGGEALISLDDLRDLKAVNIDVTAKTLPEEMIAMDDLSQLSAKQQQRLLDAANQRRRGFAGNWVDDNYQSWINAGKKTWENEMFPAAGKLDTNQTTIGQKRVFQGISAEASTMDIKLKQTMEGLLGKSRESEQLRNLYGLDPATIPTREQALGAAIVGPKVDELAFFIRNDDGTFSRVGADDFIAEDRLYATERRGKVEQAVQDAEKALKDKKARVQGETKTKKDINDYYNAEIKKERNKAIADAGTQLEKDLKKVNSDLGKNIRAVRKTTSDALADAEAMNMSTQQKTDIVANGKQQIEDLQANAKAERNTIKQEAMEDARIEIGRLENNKLLELEEWQASTDRLRKTTRDGKKYLESGKTGIPGNYIGARPILDDAGNIVELDTTNWTPMNQAIRISENTKWLLDRMFFEASPKPNWFDRLTGNQYFYNTSLLNKAGKERLDLITQEVSLRSMEDPGNFWAYVEQAVKDYDALTRDPDMLSVRVNPDKIVRQTGPVYATTGPRKGEIIDYTLEDIRKVKSELSLGMYYNIEGSRITDRQLIRAIDEQIFESGSLFNLSDIQRQNLLKSAGMRPAPKPQQFGDPARYSQALTSYRQLLANALGLMDDYYPKGIRSYVTRTLNKEMPSATATTQELAGLQKTLSDASGGQMQIGVIGTPYERLFFDPQGNPVRLTPNTFKGIHKQITAQMDQTIATAAQLQASGQQIPAALARDLISYQKGADSLNAMQSTAQKIKETGDIIMKQNGLYSRPNLSMDDIDDIINSTFGKGNEKIGEAILGTETYRDLKAQLFNSRRQGLQRKVDAVMREDFVSKERFVTSGSKLLNGLGSGFYFMTLTMRPKFYVNNYLSAPSILYTQTDMNAGQVLKTLTDGMYENRKIAYTAPNKSSYYQIAVTDKNGRPWTYGELNEIIQRGGARSEASFITSAQEQDMIAFIKDSNTLSEGSIDFIRRRISGASDLATKEDYIFRAAALKNALESGMSIEEAQQVARRSLYDYNQMTDFEKSVVTNGLVFASFTRENFVGFLRAMMDAKNMKKYLNILKYDRGMEMLASEIQENIDPDVKWDPNIYRNDYMLTKTIFYKEDVADDAGQSYYFGGPAIPAMDAMALAGSLISNPYEAASGTLKGLVAPPQKLILGIRTSFDEPPRRVPDDIIKLLYAKNFIDPDSPNEVAEELSLFVGSKVTPVPSKDALYGYVYPLTEAQGKAYADRMRVLNTLTFNSLAPAKEWLNIFGQGVTAGEAGTKYETSNVIERSIMSISGVKTPEQQELYNLYLRKRALQEQLKQEEKRLKETRDARKRQKQAP